MILRSDDDLRALLARTTTIAVVGASDNPMRPSYGVFRALRRYRHLRVTPINPALTELDGEPAFPTLAAYAAAQGAPDLVDVFRRPADAAAVASEAAAAGARAIWFQLGAAGDEGVRAAAAEGLDVVAERCLKTEYARLHR